MAMNVYIALIRGINVGGNNIVKMQDLKALFEDLGFRNARTYIQSGNVVFETGEGDNGETVRQTIEDGFRAAFGFGVSVVVRSAEELVSVIAGNPFELAAAEDFKRLHVFFLSGEPDKEALERLAPYENGEDMIRVAGRDMYILFHTKISDSPLFKVSLDKVLGLSATSRNWNTVTKLAAMAGE
ncbi:DUF1697 domain-containing protein [Paenibacillus sp. HN-1]|uniref:DUF1697 domain-containing protein n=1 Tax=Paenibacillus TaxID=44249 RepID=UPI001CA7E24D|nr:MULTISPECIES: DUF1697 domain-containing protein [Paenibacillus]MBY9079892.1 DUF1697 domain-containing protein [Paenibacillus sp. CGMCC 1.18879]MBY9084533.1 DUF1697 domain-containing protein [Paenibacillus sinensis]